MWKCAVVQLVSDIFKDHNAIFFRTMQFMNFFLNQVLVPSPSTVVTKNWLCLQWIVDSFKTLCGHFCSVDTDRSWHNPKSGIFKIHFKFQFTAEHFVGDVRTVTWTEERRSKQKQRKLMKEFQKGSSMQAFLGITTKVRRADNFCGV